MDFSLALLYLKQGRRVQRVGWNGKGMYVCLQDGYPKGGSHQREHSQSNRLARGTICKFLPYLLMRTAQGEFVPWLISQTDALADDWALTD